ncbi:MAG: adenosylcobinamide-GDP ribazoletransferase [Selenomonadaceae bacterium]|nr:adenosylcobinamide-GDP ribazoletransferase [Selenomonadaceae bacterium]
MKPFFIALQFLTRIQVVKQNDWSAEDFGRSVAFFPLVGGVLGIIIGGAAYVLFVALPSCGVTVPTHLGTACLTLMPLILTGGLHADGLMDAADGLLSGRDREKILAIMKDSRVGASGVMVFGGLLLLNWSLLLDMERALLPTALFLAPVIARLAMTLVIVKFPYARPQGIGHAFARYAPPWTLKVAALTTVCALLPWGISALTTCLVTMLFALWLARSITKKIGGLTGDTYGAIEILCETAVLLLLPIANGL